MIQDASPSKWAGGNRKERVPDYIAIAAVNQTPGETPLPCKPCGTVTHPAGCRCYLAEGSTKWGQSLFFFSIFQSLIHTISIDF